MHMWSTEYVKVISMLPKARSSFQDLTEDKCIKTILREAVMNVRTSVRVGLDKFYPVKWFILPAGSARKNRLFCLNSVSEKISALRAVFIFANIEGSPGPKP